MAYAGMAFVVAGYANMSYEGRVWSMYYGLHGYAHVLMAYIVMAFKVMASIVMALKIIASIVMASVFMAFMVMP